MTKNTSSCALQPSESQVCGGPTTICFFFSLSLHLQPPTRCPQSASIYSSRPLIREKRQQKRQFSKEGKRDCGCVVWSAWKFTCHWFPLCPSPPHAAVCCLKDWKRKHRPAGPSSNPSASSGEGPEAERHLNRDAVCSAHLLEDLQYNRPLSLNGVWPAGEQTHKNMLGLKLLYHWELWA